MIRKEEFSLYLSPFSPAKLARLSLSLPPLALSLPLPTNRVGFWETGMSREKGGRKRGASTGSDPDDEEDEDPDDAGRVIVVTETDVDRRVGLRSLLKSPREPMDKERERARNVSFFDDVTVYLFDQVGILHHLIKIHTVPDCLLWMVSLCIVQSVLKLIACITVQIVLFCYYDRKLQPMS